MTPRRAPIDVTWLIQLRWAAVLGQLATILFVALGLRVDLPLLHLACVLVVELASNAALQAARGRRVGPALVGERVAGAVMVFDVFLLTVLLYLTGGVANPFSAFYLVNVALAAVLLGARWAWALAALATAGYVTLYFAHLPLEVVEESGAIRLQGLLVAFVGTASILVWFVTRVRHELETREIELQHERERQARHERLEGLATLAAGAAHELSTPLSTIAVAARELERDLEREGPGEEAAEDARLIRDEVARCHGILEQMRFESGSSGGEELASVALGELVHAVLEDLADAERVDASGIEPARTTELFVPRRALALALRGLVKNALDASAPAGHVSLSAEQRDRRLYLVVYDRGEGMAPDVARRALDPFFTTKEPGRGMGLGLFLARSVVERLGGELHLESRPGVGTKARVELPLEPLRQATS